MTYPYDDDDEYEEEPRSAPPSRRAPSRRPLPSYDEDYTAPPPRRRAPPPPRDDDDEYDDYAPSPSRRAAPPPRSRRYRAADDDEYDDYAPYGGASSVLMQPAPASSGAGCARAVLYVVLGAVAALALVLLFFSTTLRGIGDVFSQPGQLPQLVASPTPTINVTAPAVVQRIQSLSRLETTSYTIEKVIEAGVQGNALEDLFFGDNLLLIARGTVTAGIDLSQISEQNVTVSPDGRIVTVQLPPAQILSTALDNEGTRVYDRNQGFFAQPDKDLETEARRAAESQILAAACEDGILQRASTDSQRAMEQFLSLLEVDQVIVQAAPVSACPTNS